MGKQVANNTTTHYWVELWEDEDGTLSVVKRKEGSALIKGEYLPIGKSFQFPKVWGLKEGCVMLVQHYIQDNKKIIGDAQARINKLEECLERVKNTNY